MIRPAEESLIQYMSVTDRRTDKDSKHHIMQSVARLNREIRSLTCDMNYKA